MTVFRVVDVNSGFANREPQVVTGVRSPEQAAKKALGLDLVRSGAPAFLRAQVYFSRKPNEPSTMVRLYTMVSNALNNDEYNER